jgi:SAM-dependent methyltransferase
MASARLWNANIHYHRLLLNAIPSEARHVLDVGCGDGILCAQLAQAGVRHVVGIDSDADVLDRAKSLHSGSSIEWVHGNILDVAFDEEFDAVLSVATLHHMDAARGLARFAQLVRPGGVVGSGRACGKRLVGSALRGNRPERPDHPRFRPRKLAALGSHGLAPAFDLSADETHRRTRPARRPL